MDRAAEHLERFAHGTLPRAPVLNVGRSPLESVMFGFQCHWSLCDFLGWCQLLAQLWVQGEAAPNTWARILNRNFGMNVDSGIVLRRTPAFNFFHSTKEMNPLRLETERVEKQILAKYKGKRKHHHIFAAAAKLWAAGVAWEKALETVSGAFDAFITETS